MALFLFMGLWGYLTFDTLSKGQSLTTTTRVKLKSIPGVGNKIAIIPKGEQVTYLEKKYTRTRWHESGKCYHNFWRKVEIKDGRIGWIYGAYLK